MRPRRSTPSARSKSLDVNPEASTSFTVGVPTADFRKALGKDAELRLRHDALAADADAEGHVVRRCRAVRQRLQGEIRLRPRLSRGVGAADVETLAKAIEKAGSLDPKKVRDAIAAVDFDSLYAHVKFNASGQIVLPQIVIQIQNGQVTPIFTDKFIDKPVFPVPAWSKRK